MEMAPKTMDRLKTLRDKTEAASYAEVVRRALQLYEAMIEEHEHGSEISIRRKDGDIVSVFT